MTEQTPNPGSAEAHRLGCTCARTDNHYGRGIDRDGTTFWINADCPLHGAMDDEGEREKTA